MRLTVYTDYALRVLMYLAVQPEPRPTIGEIARAHAVSRNHLMKVVHDLGRAGFIETTRGNRGGLRLKRPAAGIGLGEVIRRTEPDLDLVPCFAHGEPCGCVISPACRLRGALHRARAAFLEVLDQYSLADLVQNHDALLPLLRGGVDEPGPAPRQRPGPAAGAR
jgi:Rrf2 family nitric oxide-sensitive transcriptional repressor